jgi:NACHT domain
VAGILRHYGVVRHHKRAGRIILLVFLLGIAIGWFFLERFLRTRGLTWAANLAAIVTAVIAIATAVNPLLKRLWVGPPAMSTQSATQAADDLAAALRREWMAEDNLWQINDPRALPVRWEVTPTAEAAMSSDWRDDTSTAATMPSAKDLIGQFDDIYSVFVKIPARRLVLLGVTGAGKSVLARKLALGLLAGRQGGAVPVILRATTWNTQEALFDWIAAQLIRTHPALALRMKVITGEIKSLADVLAHDTVLPIIDGLDELPEEARMQAVTEINAAGSNIPLIVTSRPAEYLAAIQAAERPIAAAVAVELRPLRLAEIQKYLQDATSTNPAHRWDALFARMNAEPNGALATVLATPLMLWLCRTIYERGYRDPAELAGDIGFTDEATIENYFLDAFIPAIYARGRKKAFAHSWRAVRARRWLAFLAEFADGQPSADLAWWQLNRAIIRWRPIGAALRGALISVVIWLSAVWVLRSHGEWRHGVYVRRIPLHKLLFSGPLGSTVWPSAYGLIKFGAGDSNHNAHIVIRYAGNFIGTALSWHSLPLFASKVALIGLVVFSLRSSAKTKIHVPKAPSLKINTRSLLKELRGTLPGLLVLFAIWGFFAHKLEVMIRSVFFVIALLGIGIVLSDTVNAFTPSIDISKTINPINVLRLDRWAFIIRSIFGGITSTALIYFFCGTSVALAVAVVTGAGILCELTLGSSNAGASASSIFTDARIWLSGTRRLPWRVMGFLTDAHQRGALRQVGAVYEFRHIRLQQRLAASRRSRSRLRSARVSPRPPTQRAVRARLGSPIQRGVQWFGETGVGAIITDVIAPQTRPSKNASTTAWLGPAWTRQFRAAAALLPNDVQVQEPVSEIYRAGPAVAQDFADDTGEWSWTIFALPGRLPVTVPRPVWEGLRQAGKAASGADAFTALGVPKMLSAVNASQRLILAEAGTVILEKGTWGKGRVERDEETTSWHWIPEDITSSVVETGAVLKYPPGKGSALFALGAAATLEWSAGDVRRTEHEVSDLANLVRNSDLIRELAKLARRPGSAAAAGRWQVKRTGSADRVRGLYILADPDGRHVITLAAHISVRSSAGSSRQIISRVRINFFPAWFYTARTRDHVGLAGELPTPNELANLLSRAWLTAADVLPTVLVPSTAAVPVARPEVELAMWDSFLPDQPDQRAGTWSTRMGNWFVATLWDLRTRTVIKDPSRLAPIDRHQQAHTAVALLASQMGYEVQDELRPDAGGSSTAERTAPAD